MCHSTDYQHLQPEPTAEPAAPVLLSLEVSSRGTLQATVEVDGRRITLLITRTTPGASNGLPEVEPVLVVWDGHTEPIGRVALGSRLIAAGWQPYAAAAPIE